MKTFGLTPKFDGRKSFYGKATVTQIDGGETYLDSYNTRVAQISADGKTAYVYDWCSSTTARHIKEFLLQHGFPVPDSLKGAWAGGTTIEK